MRCAIRHLAAGLLLLAGACAPAGDDAPGTAPATAASTARPAAPSTAALPSGAAGLGAAPVPSRTGPTTRPPAPRPATAAARYGWTNLVARDDFTATTLDRDWGAYDSPGNSGEGRRSPGQISIRDGVLTMRGTADGTTAGMAWDHPQRYGRWEMRARFPAGCACYHPVLILWPADHPWPEGGEIDYAEVFDARRRTLNFFLHHGADNDQIAGRATVDMTRWRAFAVEWTPDHISGFVDGERFFHTTRRETFPPGRMDQTIQLDWFPDGSGGTATLQVDWVAVYRL